MKEKELIKKNKAHFDENIVVSNVKFSSPMKHKLLNPSKAKSEMLDKNLNYSTRNDDVKRGLGKKTLMKFREICMEHIDLNLSEHNRLDNVGFKLRYHSCDSVKKEALRHSRRSSIVLLKKLSSAVECKLIKGVVFAQEANLATRKHMEDFINIENANIGNVERIYILCDGHSGEKVAQVIVSKLPEIFYNCLRSTSKNKTTFDVNKAITESFKEMDDFLKTIEDDLESSGSTVNLVYICKEKNSKVIYSGNVGDSRTVLVRQDKAERLSYDHKSSDITEQKRVRKEGGFIIKNRLFGTLAITRALGDFEMKDGISGLSIEPYISRTPILDTDKYLVIASDGVWDVISDNKLFDLINEYDNNGMNNKVDLAKLIVNKAVEFGSSDNITCIVIKLS